jgi:hypothetical protein
MSRNESHNLFVLALHWDFDAFASLHLPDFLGQKTFFGKKKKKKNKTSRRTHCQEGRDFNLGRSLFRSRRQQLLALWFIISIYIRYSLNSVQLRARCKNSNFSLLYSNTRGLFNQQTIAPRAGAFNKKEER